MVTAPSAQEAYSIAEQSYLAAEKRIIRRQKMARAAVFSLCIVVSEFGNIAATDAGKLLFFFLLVTYLSLFILIMWQENEPHDSASSIK